MSERVALVFGASGISGWATTRELLRYPTPTTFSRVIALSNRPLSRETVQLEDSRLELYSGVDLTQSVDVVVKTLREKVPEIDRITHVYWYAYVHAPTDGTQTEVNEKLLDTTLYALKETSPRMQHFTLQTGGKYYGALFPDKMHPAPLKESLPRLPEPWASSIFYYKQLDVIAKHAKSAAWRWNDVRPDAIIGYAPTVNAMNLALVLGVYLSLYRAVHGRGAAVPLPANLAGALARTTESPADQLARCTVWLSLRSDDALNGRSFNIGGPTSSYADRWADIAGMWDLKGVATQRPTNEDPWLAGTEVAKWASEHAEAWRALEREHGLRPGVFESTGFDFLIVMAIPLDRQFDLGAIREVGWKEEGNAMAAYKDAWARFAEAKFIPPM